MKTIVTHISPDLDAIASVWLIKRYMKGWEESSIAFVPAGKTLNNEQPDSNPEVIHVDTGFGQFDHHQTNADTCATKLIFTTLLTKNMIKKGHIGALERMIAYINQIDHFQEVFFEEAGRDRADFSLGQLTDSLKAVIHDDIQLTETVFPLLDATLQFMKQKITAEGEIKNAFAFTSAFGKSLAVKTRNSVLAKVATKQGYELVITKDPVKGNVRIHTLPGKKHDLTSLYEKLKQADKKATWFLHASRNILLNGSSKNPHMIPSYLSIQKLIEIVKSI